MPGMRRGRKNQQPQEPSWWNAAPDPAHFGLGPEWSVVPARPGEPEPRYHRPPFGLPVTPEEREAHRPHDDSWYLNERGTVRNHVCQTCGNVKEGPHVGKKAPVFRRVDSVGNRELSAQLRVVTPEGFLYHNPEDVAEAERLGYDHNYSGAMCEPCLNDELARLREKRRQREQAPGDGE